MASFRGMPRLPADLYRRWLGAAFPPPALHEGFVPPERWLQQIWRHQRLRRDALRTLDGEALTVLHPGFWNRAAGPDFRGAILRFGGAAAVRGDVEIDLVPSGWRGHRHAGNPAYHGVVLHVVWDARQDGAGRPAMALREHLDAPLAELAPWLCSDAPRLLPDNVRGQCVAPLQGLSPETLGELVRQAALARLARKSGAFAARARHAGWHRALWEGLLGGLGFRHNVWPMRRVAELLGPDDNPSPGDVVAAQACLLGVAGLLPPDSAARHPTQFRALWDRWWHERDRFHGLILPADAWRLGGVRPANHPQRRLALAAHWMSAGPPFGALDGWMADAGDARETAESLRCILGAGPDDFWERHWTLESPALAAGQPLLGHSRATDLAVSVVLPWLLARAAAGSDPAMRQRVEERYLGWPAGEDNAVLRLARQRLLGGARRVLPGTAATQQGLIGLAQDFCAHADALCTGCRLPDLVRGLAPVGVPG